MEILKIVALAILAAVTYGIVHDQVTARVCLEYFTVAHPPVFGNLSSPTLLGIGWGIIATWWVGLFLGVPLAICARIGSLPKLAARDLVQPFARLLAILFVCAMAAGIAGGVLAEKGALTMPANLETRIPPEHHARFFADAFAHLTSYGLGTLFGVVLWVRVLMRRYKMGLHAAQSGRKADGEPIKSVSA